ncbi:MAG: hypothetical protein LBU32_10095 [Clostridiales bacterium]|nr:hypothetical protein [Clostridiales bacterium]
MNNQLSGINEANSANEEISKKEIGLPLIALGLNLFPWLLFFAASLTQLQVLTSFAFHFMVLSPITGLIMGVISLCQGKARIGMAGKILAIVAIAWPLFWVAYFIVFFIGAATGVISFM